MGLNTGKERSNSNFPWLPRILIIDHHDSYTLNVLVLLVSALKLMNKEDQTPTDTSNPSTSANTFSGEDYEISNLLSRSVLVLPHTHAHLSPEIFDRHLRYHIDAIILSPGPGSPDRDQDFGTAASLIRHLSAKANSSSKSSSPLCIPIFGVCLGHQGLASVFGGSVKRSSFIRHGTCSRIRWKNPQDSRLENPKVGKDETVFEGILEGTRVVRYNSLTVDPNTLPSCFRVTAWAFDSSSNSAPAPKSNAFSPPLDSSTIRAPSSPSTSTASPNLKPSSDSSPPRGLKDLKPMETSDSLPSPPSTAPASPVMNPTYSVFDGSEEGEAVILALEHESLPFWGVQFHPESVESEGGGQMMFNFLNMVKNWWSERAGSSEEASSKVKCWEQRSGLPSEIKQLGGECVSLGSRLGNNSSLESSTHLPDRSWSVISRRFKRGEMPSKERAPQVFESLFRFGQNKQQSNKIGKGVGSVWLDSARARDPNSRYSYMSSPSFSLSYHSESNKLCVSKNSKDGNLLTSSLKIKNQDQQEQPRTLWSWMDQVQQSLQNQTDTHSCLGDLDSDDHSKGLDPPISTRKVRDLSMWRTGFVGYWGYEMWHESLGIGSKHATNSEQEIGIKPDAEFGFCDRVLALDSERDEWVAFALVKNETDSILHQGPLFELQQALQSLNESSKSDSSLGLSSEEADSWFEEVTSTLLQITKSDEEETKSSTSSISRKRSKSQVSRAELPPLRPDDEPEFYKSKVEAAREYIASGESYELCLTTQFRGTLPPLSTISSATNAKILDSNLETSAALDLDHFSMYKALRTRNPAPYSAFFHLPRLSSSSIRERSILCTSPERFMRISKSGEVEMKPIKGTLARAGWGKGEETMRPIGVGDRISCTPIGGIDERKKKEWREKEDEKRRKSLAADVKERAENLMIVDLIRAELLSFCLPSSVRVPALMKVESYATVHQLVTSVCGTLRSGIGSIEAQRRCHSPGSMTGAPKRRSMQILERLEPAGRGKASRTSPSTSSSSPPLSTSQNELSSREIELGRRGIYSGTLGWIGIDGASDMAVVIRTAVVDGDDVSLGAGGAITYLSDPHKEWSEVLDKASALSQLDLSSTSK